MRERNSTGSSNVLEEMREWGPRAATCARHRRLVLLDNVALGGIRHGVVRRRLLLLALSAWTLAGSAKAAERGTRIGGVYSLAGTSDINAQIGPVPYRRTVQSTVEVKVEPAEDARVTLTVSADGRTCTLAALMTDAETLTLTPQQHCPQLAQLDGGAQLELDGALDAGQAVIHEGRMTLTTQWSVTGALSMGGLRIPVSGTIRASEAGTRKS
jgi:hypothetical protein